MTTKIMKTYTDKEDWFKTTEEEFIEHTEGNGYWKPGTALQTLHDCGQMRTPWAIYKLVQDKTTID